jgi:GNAT superfamily N-acetyltransferase
MNGHPLDNPIWSALRSRHRALARGVGEVARYPADVAPFLGIASGDADVMDALDELIAPGESVYLLGVTPRVADGWSLKPYAALAQMERTSPLDVIDGPEAIALGPEHRDDVLALTALVYPHYFRPRTMEMGRYFGIYEEDRLAAITGERLGTEDCVELSAICTHPDFLGRGYARRLLALLVNDLLEQGMTPFLHVSYENPRALELYRRMGFAHRPDIGFWSLRRA